VAEEVVDERGWGSDTAITPAWPREQVVVLLENADGTVGKVDVASPEGSATLDQPRQAASFSNPEETFVASREQVGELLATVTATPERPVQFTLYFDTGVELTEESAIQLEKILSILKGRSAPEVSLAGHTDRVGSEGHNLRVSQNRAVAINQALLDAGLTPDRIDIAFYGETQPAAESADGQEEPRNRRVEVRIR